MATPGSFVAGTALSAAEMNLLPGGTVGYAERTTDQTTITVQVDITSLTVTWTAVAGRRYKITGKVEVTSTAADGAYVLVLTDAANTSKQRATDACLTTSGRTVTLTHVEEPGSGSITRKLRLSKAGGTGSLTAGAAAASPAFLLVEDVGV